MLYEVKSLRKATGRLAEQHVPVMIMHGNILNGSATFQSRDNSKTEISEIQTLTLWRLWISDFELSTLNCRDTILNICFILVPFLTSNIELRFLFLGSTGSF